MSILLTPRWFELPQIVEDHSVQTQLKQDILSGKYRNFTIVAGRRSYKTERFLKRYFVYSSITEDNKVYFLGAPTRSQAKEIFWKDVKALSNPVFIKGKPSEVDLRINYKSGSSLHVVGLKEFKRVQGGLAHMVGVTEYQDCEPGVYSESFEPMLNDTNGMWIGEGRPFGKNHLFDDFQKGVKGVKGFSSYHWKASEILSAEQIERAKTNLAEKDYLREYDASFETLTGNPYYAYSQKNHKKWKYNPNLPIILTCDFNATEKPMSWVTGQRTDDIVHWGRSLSYQFTNTITMCGVLDDYFLTLGDYPKKMLLYGDYAGNRQESNATETDIQIIEKYFTNKLIIIKNFKQCKSIRNSIGATNAQLCNTLGQVRQYVDIEGCNELILDWEKGEWADNSRELKEVNTTEGYKRGHCCRAVDYFNDYEFPIQSRGTIRNLR